MIVDPQFSFCSRKSSEKMNASSLAQSDPFGFRFSDRNSSGFVIFRIYPIGKKITKAKGSTNLDKIIQSKHIEILQRWCLVQFCHWFCCSSETTLYTLPLSYLCCPSQAESGWLIDFGVDHSEGSPAWINGRGKGFSIIGFAQHNNCPHEPQFSWTAPCLAGSSHCCVASDCAEVLWSRASLYGTQLWLRLRCLTPRIQQNPLLAAAIFFSSFIVFCTLKQGPLTREHALACGCPNDLAHRPCCHTSLVI